MTRKQSSKHHNQYLSGLGSKHKFTTRHLAALDFLLNIPLKNETRIIETGSAVIRKQKEKDLRVDENDLLEPNHDSKLNAHDQLSLVNSSVFHLPKDDGIAHAPGRKLQGRLACMGRIPTQIRYHMNRFTEQGAVVRQWEDSLLRGPVTGAGLPPQPLLESRIFFSRARGYPITVMSIVKYAPEEEAKRLQRQKNEGNRALEIFITPQRDWRGISYASLLKPWQPQGSQARSATSFSDYTYFWYEPNSLDDPEMIQGKHRSVRYGAENIGPVVSSVILFVNAQDLKQSLNEQFREKHPNLPPSLTLSKIRNLKKSVLLGCLAIDIEVSTVALAVVYFEQLCLQGSVTKSNRHLTMAVMLLLAYKFNQPVQLSTSSSNNSNRRKLEALFDFFDQEWSLPKKEVLEAEFGAFVLLGFSLNAPFRHVYLVFKRLLTLAHKTTRMYLTEEILETYSKDVMWLEQQSQALKREEAQLRDAQRESLVVSVSNNSRNSVVSHL